LRAANGVVLVTTKKGKREKTEPILIDEIEKRHSLIIGSASFQTQKTILFQMSILNSMIQGGRI
jgi:hypothetical protein